jgi:hypothetical protein
MTYILPWAPGSGHCPAIQEKERRMCGFARNIMAQITEKELDAIIEGDTDSSIDITAAADEVDTVENEPEDTTQEEIEKETIEEDRNGKFFVRFFQKYKYKDKEIEGIDMSGLQDLTARDAQRVDRIMARLGHFPQNKFNDSVYAKHIAVIATGMSLEFFNDLQIRDMLLITAKVNSYFLFG